MENTISSTFIAQETDRVHKYVLKMIDRKHKNGAVRILKVEHINLNGGRGRPHRVCYLGRDDALKIILFLSGREKSEDVRSRLEEDDRKNVYSAREAAVYLNGERVGECSEIELPTTNDEEGEQEMTSNQVAVRQGDGELRMSSLEIAKLTDKRHPDVKRDIEVMSEGLEGDVSKFAHTYKDSQNRNQNMYLLDRYHTEILITGYDVKRRAAVIKRWFDLESGEATPHYQQEQFQVPQTMSGALKLAAEQWEARERAEAQALEYKGQSEQYQKQIETQTPWVDFARSVSETGKNVKVNEAAKLLNVKPSYLNQCLKDWKWINPQRMPYQRVVDAGYLVERAHSYTKPNGDVTVTYVPLITGKGLGRLHRLLNI